MNRVAVIGMVGNSAFFSVDALHQAGETVAAKSIHFEPGGKGFNQAVAAARFGAQVSFLGAVGAEYRSEIEDFLKKDKIVPFLVQKEGSTAFASILTDAIGRNRVTVYQGVSLEEKDLEPFLPEIAKADVLLLNNEVPFTINLTAARVAKENGTNIIWNPAPSIRVNEEFLTLVDLATPNEYETAGLDAAKNLVITLGSRGCFLKKENQTVPALSLNPVDTTGAGDTFNGVLACELSSGKSMQDAVQSAVYASGVSVMSPYAATAIPTRREVVSFLEKMGIESSVLK